MLLHRPGGIPARNRNGERLLLYLGVIDILQSYRLLKRAEHTWKAIIADGVSGILGPKVSKMQPYCSSTFYLMNCFYHLQDSVSVHNPGFYAERFLNFMAETVFKKTQSRKFARQIYHLLLNLASYIITYYIHSHI